MKKRVSMMVFVAACLLAASPVFAHCGKCGMEEKAYDGAEMKQCKPGCDKPCCAQKDAKDCSMHGKKDCCDKKGHGSAKTNFGPRSRK